MSRERFIQECRKLGMGDLTIGRRNLLNEPLKPDEWGEVYRALLAFQYHIRLIVAKSRSEREHET